MRKALLVTPTAMQPKQPSGEIRQTRARSSLTSSGGVGLERSPSETGTSESVIMIDMMAKMVKPPAPKIGMRNWAPVTEPMSTIR